ncbi:MAG TPA: glycosyltransferase [Pseudomonadales bacterium]|nr:glycosyltransferase [Pseudomonadales bacterium]
MILLNSIFAALAVLSLALSFWQYIAARKFPLHGRIADPAFSPAISVLKPLKGCDATTADSLVTWFNQDYPGAVQILFGVANADDPVCGLVRELIQKNPGTDAQLIICGEALGANAKVSTLVQLEKLAKYDVILFNDADVRAPADFLGNVVAPLRQPEVALVNCFYRLANSANTAMQWESVAINADFWSHVLQAQTLKPLDFALGAAILVRQKSLNDAGGFAALANCLADDYQIGNRIAKNGGKIALCPVVVECWDPPMTWRAVWKHQLRWARTIRVSQPVPYFFSILSNATLWPLLWFVVELATARTFCAPLGAIVPIFVRIAFAQNLQRRFVQSSQMVAPFWLVPVKDLLQAAIWATAFLGNKIEWRGQKMRLRRNGDLEPAT